jgi:hypothetical protein
MNSNLQLKEVFDSSSFGDVPMLPLMPTRSRSQASAAASFF